MASNDVEMEDAQMPDPGNGIKESEDKVLDFDIGLKGNDLLSAVAVSGNADKSENGNGSDDKLSNEAKDQIIAMCELENQTHHEKDTSEPMSIEPVEARGERVDTISIDEEEISTEANPKVQTDSGILVQKLSDAKADTESKNEDEISTKANAEVLTVSGNIVQKLTEATSKIVGNSDVNDKLKVEDPVKNGLECENPVEKNVLGDSIDENPVENLVGDSGGDVAVKKTRGSEEDDNCAKNVAKIDMTNGNSDSGRDTREDMKLETGLFSNEAPQVQNITLDDVSQSGDKQMEDGANANEVKTVNDESKQQVPEIVVATPVTDGNTKTVETVTKLEVNDSSQLNQHEVAASNSFSRYLPANLGSHSEETEKTIYSPSMIPLVGESDDGTSEDQAAFIRELENFYRERAMDFKPPKFYGQPLNCLKLWRAVIRLGGYDRVTGSKLWRQVGESFHPPKTCTTVSWTFRIFYEKSLLEYERHKRISGDLQLPTVFPEASGATVDIEGNSYQGSGSGRARRDAAARAMQGWHVQRQGDYGEAGEPVTKDKNISNMSKREKNIKSIASLKQKRPNEVEHPVKAARSEASKQLATSVVDIGPPADWVKINVLQTKECFEVYALIPGLLRNEVRVQSDPVGRLVITGQPEQLDNPWGITPFKKLVSLPARIDPLQTSAVVSHHGRLLVRVPFESNS